MSNVSVANIQRIGDTRMKSRQYLRLSATLAAALLSGSDLWAQDFLALKRSFQCRIGNSAGVATVQKGQVTASGMYLLTSGGRHDAVSFSHFDGQGVPSFTRAITGAMDLQRLDSGNILIQRMSKTGIAFDEYTPKGELVRTLALDRPVSHSTIIGSAWLRFDGTSLGWATYPPDPSRPPTLVRQLGMSYYTLQQPLAGSVLVIDRVDGRCADLHPGSGAAPIVVRITSPDLSSSIAAYSAIRKNASQMPPGARLAQGLPITSSTADERGNVFVALSPYSVSEGAVVLQIGADCAVRKRFRCQISRTNDPNDAITPSYMGVIGQELLFVSRNGAVGVFDLPR